MSGDWPTKALAELDRISRKRHRELLRDPRYLEETDQLRRKLEEAYGLYPPLVRGFFRQFSWPVGLKLRRMHAFLLKVDETAPRLTPILRRYCEYANRFRVQFVLRGNPPHFETVELLPSGGRKFHVKILDGRFARVSVSDEEIDSSLESADVELPPAVAKAIKRVRVADAPVSGTDDEEIDSSLESADVELPPAVAKAIKRVRVADAPVSGTDDEEIDSSFESADVKLPAALAKAVERGDANFFRIDDAEGSSCLSILEQVSYFPEGMTLVLHQAEQPYIMCLIGEKVSVKLWRELGRSVTAILREEFNRGKAGRPKDLQKLRRAKTLLKKPGPLKEKAAILAGEALKIPSMQSYLSHVRKAQKT